jgi:hypothetical protein
MDVPGAKGRGGVWRGAVGAASGAGASAILGQLAENSALFFGKQRS